MITSLSTDCWTEQLSSSDEDGFTWESSALEKCPQAFVERGFATELEEWNFYTDLAKHFEEVDEDVASYVAYQPKWTNRAKLSWRKTKTGRRRARQGTRSSLPAVAEEKASDAFLETI
eukprot:6471598-Amphidinium_carterae.1